MVVVSFKTSSSKTNLNAKEINNCLSLSHKWVIFGASQRSENLDLKNNR
jgi:hypothetical protein